MGCKNNIPIPSVVKTIIHQNDEEYINSLIDIMNIKLEHQWYDAKCDVCGKRTHRYTYVGRYLCCSSCRRKVIKALHIAVGLKKYRSAQRSKGARYGYKLATSEHATPTFEWLTAIIKMAQKDGQKVFFLGRDMDAFYNVYQLEENVVYLSGWNRDFKNYANFRKKEDLVEHYGIVEDDYVVDTGFVGSILVDINQVVPIKGFLLSAETTRWNYLRHGSDYSYRSWIVAIEHISRSRTVEISGRLPQEVYRGSGVFEQGFFEGFRKGAFVTMH